MSPRKTGASYTADSPTDCEVVPELPKPVIAAKPGAYDNWFTKRKNYPTTALRIEPANFGLTPCAKRPKPATTEERAAHAEAWEYITCVVRNEELATVKGFGPNEVFSYNPTRWDVPKLWSIPCGIPVEIPKCIAKVISDNRWKVEIIQKDYSTEELEHFIQGGQYIGLTGRIALEKTEPVVSVSVA